MSTLPHSEKICKRGLYPHCKGCNKATYGWDFSGNFYNERNIFSFYVLIPGGGFGVKGEDFAKELGYKDLEELAERCDKIMKSYLSKPKKLFKKLPPVEIRLVGPKKPSIEIKESGIMMSFMIEPTELTKPDEICFDVAFFHSVSGDKFKLVAQHNHPIPDK